MPDRRSPWEREREKASGWIDQENRGARQRFYRFLNERPVLAGSLLLLGGGTPVYLVFGLGQSAPELVLVAMFGGAVAFFGAVILVVELAGLLFRRLGGR